MSEAKFGIERDRTRFGRHRRTHLPVAPVANIGAPIRISVVSTEEDFNALASDWDRLVNESDCTIFQTYEWQRTWWKYYGKGRELHCLVFEDKTGVIGIAPMFLQKVKFLGVRVTTVLQFFSEWHVDLIALPPRQKDVAQALADYFKLSTEHRDIFEMSDVNEHFAIRDLLPEYLKKNGLRTYTYRLLRGSQPHKSEEFGCIPSANWQIRAVVPSVAHLIRFRVFIIRELLNKAVFRLRTEYHAARRLHLAEENSILALAKFSRTEAIFTIKLLHRFLRSMFLDNQGS